MKEHAAEEEVAYTRALSAWSLVGDESDGQLRPEDVPSVPRIDANLNIEEKMASGSTSQVL